MRRFLHLLTIPLALSLGVACGDATSGSGDQGQAPGAISIAYGGQTGAEVGINCNFDSPLELELDQESELGFSANDVLAEMGGSYEDTWTWADGSTSVATLKLEHRSGDVLYRQSQPLPDLPEEGPPCAHQLEIPATLTLSTDDGRLDERWPVRLVTSNGTWAELSSAEPIEQLRGSYRVEQEVVGYLIWFRYQDAAIIGELGAELKQAVPPTSDQLLPINQVQIGVFGELESAPEDALSSEVSE